MANGAKQILHPLFFKTWFPNLDKKKVILSENFLRKQFFFDYLKNIKD